MKIKMQNPMGIIESVTINSKRYYECLYASKQREKIFFKKEMYIYQRALAMACEFIDKNCDFDNCNFDVSAIKEQIYKYFIEQARDELEQESFGY